MASWKSRSMHFLGSTCNLAAASKLSMPRRVASFMTSWRIWRYRYASGRTRPVKFHTGMTLSSYANRARFSSETRSSPWKHTNALPSASLMSKSSWVNGPALRNCASALRSTGLRAASSQPWTGIRTSGEEELQMAASSGSCWYDHEVRCCAKSRSSSEDLSTS